MSSEPAVATVNNPLIAATRGSAAQAIAYGAANGATGFYAAYIQEAYRLASLCSLDALLVVAQSAEETACWTSPVWQQRGNPAGIGYTGDPTQDAASPIFTSGIAAATAHIAHVTLYATGDIARGGLSSGDDPRYAAYIAAYGKRAIATTLNDLSGKWATDPQYAVAIAAHANAILQTPISAPAPGAGGDKPVTDLNMTQDLVPLPPFETRVVSDSENNAWNDLGPRTVKGFVLHRMLGSLSGTDQWFRRGAASDGLTDWGSDAASGTVYLWNSPLGFGGSGASANRAPWASGPYNANGDAWGDGLAFVTKYGIDAVNRDETAWEISGNYGDPWSPAAQTAAAQACAHYAHNYGITWEQFPVHPQDGFSFVRWHQEITGPKEKICPGPVVMDATAAWIEQVRAILKAAQTQGVSPTPTRAPVPTPVPVPGVTYARKHAPTAESATVAKFGRAYTVKTVVTPRQAADPAAPAVGPDLPVGYGLTAAWVTVGTDSQLWISGSGGSYLPVSALQ